MAGESKHQKKIKDRLKKEGWLVIRLITATTTISASGVPDLLALKPEPDGRCLAKFIEVKAKNGVASPLQEYHIKKLKEMGFEAYVDVET